MGSQAVLNNKGVLTLQEASEITGIKVQTLRSRIKRGALKGFKKGSQFGEVWYVKADSIKALTGLEHDRLKVLKFNSENPLNENPSQGVLNSAEPLIRAKEEQIQTLQKMSTELEKHNTTLNEVLRVFQSRIQNLETEKAEIEGKLKLLPAPLEIIPSKLDELEEKTAALSMAENIIQQAQETQKQYEAEMAELKQKLQEEEHAKEAFRIQWELSQAELKRPWWQKFWKR